MKLDTLAVHAGAAPDKATGSMAPPIHLSTNFLHGAASEETYGYMYIRDKNPTQDRLEEAMSALEGGEDALAFSSGMGATAALLQNLEPNSHIIIPADVYVHVRLLAARFLANWQVQHSIVEMSSPDAGASCRAAQHQIDLGGDTFQSADDGYGYCGDGKDCARCGRLPSGGQYVRHAGTATSFRFWSGYCSALDHKILWRA